MKFKQCFHCIYCFGENFLKLSQFLVDAITKYIQFFKVHNALSNVANKEGSQDTDSQSESEKNISKTNSSSTTNTEKPATTKNTNTKLKGVSSSLLERIRQKEQKNIQLAMTRDPEKEEKLSKMQRLPEVCRMLKSYFTTEKKAAITLEDCVNKLSESYGTSMSQGNCFNLSSFFRRVFSEFYSLLRIINVFPPLLINLQSIVLS